MTQNPQIEALKEARQFILAPAEDLPWGVVHRIDAALSASQEAAAPSEEPVAWQWNLSDTWHTAEVDKFDDAEKYARSLAGKFGRVRAIFASPAVAPVAVSVKGLTLGDLQRAHVERQEEWCPEQKPDLSFRGNEMAGEVGEACNVIKKLERERHGWRGSRATKEQLAEELADVIHTAILCAITAGIDIEPATLAKFNATSEKNGLASRILSSIIPATKGMEDALRQVRGMLEVEYHHDGRIASVGYASDGLRKMVTLLDAALAQDTDATPPVALTAIKP